ncbi:phage minor head protein [Streptomyces sp. AGS-58]|uniref:phage minor head protein n=1 Tax=unclassified Streptomyces TaxID=2593676 RepID=UPI0035A3CC90
MADVEKLLQAAEAEVAAEVRAVLDEVAADIGRELADATEIVAARFSLAQIGRMWRARVPRLMRRLLGIAEQAAEQAAADTGSELPDGWQDLPGQHDQGDQLPRSLGSYVTDTEHLLRAIGDQLTAAAVAELAAGLDAGEDITQLRARLREVLSRQGAQLGEMREERVARTESTRAWNSATLAAAQDLTTPGRPLVKQWVTRHDRRVRHAHNAVDGALRLLDEAFTVGGHPMQYPGDPLAPAALTVNCRCVLRLAPELRAAATGSEASPRPGVFGSKAEGVTAAAATHTGAMIALVPSEEDQQRMALADGELADELHCTLIFLGAADGWSTDQREQLVAMVREYAPRLPIAARAFGVAHWNPHGDDPVWV